MLDKESILMIIKFLSENLILKDKEDEDSETCYILSDEDAISLANKLGGDFDIPNNAYRYISDFIREDEDIFSLFGFSSRNLRRFRYHGMSVYLK